MDSARRCEACDVDISHKRKGTRFCTQDCRRRPRFRGTYCKRCGGEVIAYQGNTRQTHCSLRCAERTKYHEKNPLFKEDFFSIPNLENSYWAGFIAGDGCIYDKNAWQSQVHIGLKVDDRPHLERLKDTIGAGSISTIKKTLKTTGRTYEQAKYTLYSDKICSDLATLFNIHPRKSLTHEPPDLRGDNAIAFIAGYIDADGSYTFSRNRPVLSAVGTSNFLTWMNEKLNIHSKIICCGNHYSTSVGGDGAILVRQKIHDLNLPLLERKRHRWEELGLNLKIGKFNDK